MGCSASAQLPADSSETPVTTLQPDEADVDLYGVGGGKMYSTDSESRIVISEQVARLAAPVGAAIGANLHEVDFIIGDWVGQIQ